MFRLSPKQDSEAMIVPEEAIGSTVITKFELETEGQGLFDNIVLYAVVVVKVPVVKVLFELVVALTQEF